jgi:antitoxin (DNA-binding transcriptional repressor) of toxin-antitoxin stability system
MKRIPLSELDGVAEDVRNGERVEVCEGDRVVAVIVPLHASDASRPTSAPSHETDLESRVLELAAQGLVRLGSNEPFPEDFFTRPLPGAGAGVLDQVLRDREED